MTVVVACLVMACTALAEPDATDVPFGAPFAACPASGEGAVQPRAGYELVPPGAIAFNYRSWHNETGDTRTCGAQSVQGANTTIHPADVLGDVGLPFVATLQRAVPRQAPDPIRPQMRLFRLDAGGPVLIETAQVQNDPAFQATGWALQGVPVGHYRMQIVSSSAEILAEGTFEIVD